MEDVAVTWRHLSIPGIPDPAKPGVDVSVSQCQAPAGSFWACSVRPDPPGTAARRTLRLETASQMSRQPARASAWGRQAATVGFLTGSESQCSRIQDFPGLLSPKAAGEAGGRNSPHKNSPGKNQTLSRLLFQARSRPSLRPRQRKPREATAVPDLPPIETRLPK